MNVLTLFKQVEGKEWPVYAGQILVGKDALRFEAIDKFGFVSIRISYGVQVVTHMEHVNRVFGMSPEALGVQQVETVFGRVPGPIVAGAKLSVVETETPFVGVDGAETAFNEADELKPNEETPVGPKA
jgi:hypothetical protein